jgi:hypothetical protein
MLQISGAPFDQCEMRHVHQESSRRQWTTVDRGLQAQLLKNAC